MGKNKSHVTIGSSRFFSTPGSNKQINWARGMRGGGGGFRGGAGGVGGGRVQGWRDGGFLQAVVMNFCFASSNSNFGVDLASAPFLLNQSLKRERERERQRQRQTDRQTDRDRDRQTDRDTERDRDRELWIYRTYWYLFVPAMIFLSLNMAFFFSFFWFFYFYFLLSIIDQVG